MSEIPDNLRPRTQHYVFAHKALPSQVHEHGLMIAAALGGPEGLKLLRDLWVACADEGDAQIPGDGLTADVRRTDDGRVAAVVTMPPPERMVEAHLAAIVSDPVQPTLDAGGQPGDVAVRYFTLEASMADGDTALGGRNALCEWTKDGTHHNFGTGPDADPEAFVAAVLDLIHGAGDRPFAG